MKLLLSAALLISITSSSFASCTGAFERAADKRDTVNGIALTVGVIATVITVAVLADNADDHSAPTQTTYRPRRQHHHHHHTYGVYYINTYDNDGRWLGTNNYDTVLMAYNDAVVATSTTLPYGMSSELSTFESKVAKKVVRLAKRARLSNRVQDIKESKSLSAEDKAVLQNACMDGMENMDQAGFCPNNKALTRTKVIKKLAQAVLENRQ